MPPSLIMSLVILNILILLPHCLCHHEAISTRSLSQPQLSSHSTVPKLILSKEPTSFAASTPESTTNRLPSRRQTVSYLSSHHGRFARRGIFPDFGPNTFGGFFGNSNANVPTSKPDSSAQTSRQVTYPQEFQPFPSGDSRALTNGHPLVPQPHPTQVPTALVNSPKAQTTSATSLNSLSTTSSSHSPSSTAAASPATPSPTDQPAPRSLFQRIGLYFQPTNRFNAVAILIAIGLVLAFLIGLMAVLKCVAHKRRFANKKDYPTGFPWVEPGSQSNRNSTRQGPVSVPSYISTRNSMTSSLHFKSGPRPGAEAGRTTHHVEYQLNELGPDVYGDYAWAVSQMDLEKNPSSPSDEGPSSGSTEDSSRTPSGSTQDHDRWHTQSMGSDPCFVRGGKGEILEHSKVFTIGHP